MLQMIEGIDTVRCLEGFLREAGLSKGASMALIARAKSILSRSDSGDDDEANWNAIHQRLAKMAAS